jgi:hypothetical protein
MYKIVNIKTGETVGKASSLQSARRKVDKLDNAYGAYIHQAVLIVF